MFSSQHVASVWPVNGQYIASIWAVYGQYILTSVWPAPGRIDEVPLPRAATVARHSGPGHTVVLGIM